MYYFYFSEGLSAATEFYVSMIRDALLKRGEKVLYTQNLREIPMHSKIVTINDKDFYIAYKLKKPSLTINWFQGITPEEIALMFESNLYTRLKVIGRTHTERFAVRHSDFSLFVSEQMLGHYKNKYGHCGENHIIMPCFNSSLQDDVFYTSRYETPSFVYAGNLAAWQCFDKTVMIFKNLKQFLPDATLSIFTFEIDKAKRILSQNEVEADVSNKSVTELNMELKKYKYGFIVRDDIAVNHVATPTKMANYIGAGLIPVFSNSLKAFNQNLESKYLISFSNEQECVDKILRMEERDIDIEQMKSDYESMFFKYWNEKSYIEKLSSILP